MELKIDKKAIDNAKILGGKEIAKEVLVLSESEKEFQVMDPDSYETKTIIKPNNYVKPHNGVKIIKNDNELYLIE